MRLGIAICLALAGTVGAAAQGTTNETAPLHVFPQPAPQTIRVYNPATRKTTTVVVQPPENSMACPIAMDVRQRSNRSAMEVGDGRPKGVAQFLHLGLSSGDGSQIVKATIKVRGLEPESGAALKKLTVGMDPSNAARTLDVDFPDGPGQKAATDVWVPGLSAAYSVEVIGVTWADGTVWNRAAGQTCRMPIDGLMLVGAR